MVKGVLTSDQIEGGIGEGEVVSIGASKHGVADLFFGLELACLVQHFGCQVDARRETHPRGDGQNKGPRPAGDVENKFMGLRLGKFHFFRQNIG
jgi:hypothetical protein